MVGCHCMWLVEALWLLVEYQVDQEAGKKKIESASEKERVGTTHRKRLLGEGFLLRFLQVGFKFFDSLVKSSIITETI